MLFVPNWWHHIGDVDETCFVASADVNKDDLSCCDENTFMFLGDIEEPEMPETEALAEESNSEGECDGDSQDSLELICHEFQSDNSSCIDCTNDALPCSTAVTDQIESVSEDSNLSTASPTTISCFHVSTDKEISSTVSFCWPSRDTINFIRPRHGFWPTKRTMRHPDEIDTSSTSETTEAKGISEREEWSNHLDKLDWLRLIDEHENNLHHSVDYEIEDDDNEVLLGEYIDYDAEPDESHFEEDESPQANPLKTKPRRRLRLPWFARLTPRHPRKVHFDGYQKL